MEDIDFMLCHIQQIKKDKYSHSKLELFKNCNYAYKMKYIDNVTKDVDSLSLELGSIVHKVLELKGLSKIKGQRVDYEYLYKILYNGFPEENILGIKDIKLKYADEWEEMDIKSNLNYDEKIEIFKQSVLTNEMEDEEWEVYAVEKYFEFLYLGKYRIIGYIDRIDVKRDSKGNIFDIRVVDYKTSKKVFDDNHNKTPQQFIIYGLAIYLMFGILPSEYIYNFVLINKKQLACTKGYIKRGIKKINKIFEEIEIAMDNDTYKPNPTPLCWWCSYRHHSYVEEIDEDSDNMCQYYSLWTPYNKTFLVNKQWNETDDWEI